MKRFLRCAGLLLGVQVLVWFGAAAALGLSLAELADLPVLAAVIGGFGFLIGVLLLLLIRFCGLPEIGRDRGSRWLLSILFPAASLILLVILIYTARAINEFVIGAVVSGCILVVANVAILYLLRMMARQAREEQARLLLDQQMEIQSRSILALEKSYRAQRQATHDFRNQLQTIHDLLSAGQQEQALSYVRQLQGMQTTRVFAVNTHHPILDAVLNQKYQAAKEQDIQFQFRVNDLSSLNLETDAMVVLLSNLLDNAIEGCQRFSGERMIRCSILLSDSLYLSIRNTSPPVTITDGHIPTTKEPRQEHGFGLRSVCRILEQLQAEYTFAYSEGWFQFVAEIPVT